jgi:hypothetical protein
MTDDDQILDLTGRVLFTGDQPHPYRTNTRFHKVDGQWVAIADVATTSAKRRFSTPEDRSAARLRVAKKAKAERLAMAKITKVIARRQDIGDPRTVQSRSEDFPLMEALRRDEKHEAIAVILRYRKLVALCEAEPLKGLDYSKSDGGEVVRVSKQLTPDADIDKAQASGWTVIPDGEIKQSSKIKKSRGSYASPAKRTVVADNDNVATGSVIKTESLHVKLTDEVLNAHIDAKPILAELRSSLGPLVEPFEDAVLGGKSYTDIGRGGGEKTQPSVGGRILVGMAIGSISVKWQEIDRREKHLESVALSRFRSRAA